MNKKKYAVVTGASRGLGKAFAIELAKRGINTILISSNEKIIKFNQSLIKQYHIDSHYFITDLTKKEDILATAHTINEQFETFMLINNAGVGGSRAFDEADIPYLEKILQLNIFATTFLTKSLLNNLLRNKNSYVLNVASMAALTPTAYKTVYPASKAFVYSFSLGLHEEFKRRGLTVSVVAPGAMATSPEICARIEKQGFFGKITLVSTEKIACKCIRQMLRGKREIVVTPVSWLFSKFLPNRIKSPILSCIVKNELSQS